MRRSILGVLLLAAWAAHAAGSKMFGNWSVGCNNLGACVVIGSSQTDDGGLFYMRFARDAGATAAPALEIVAVAQDDIKGAVKTLRLTANDKAGATTLAPIDAALAGDDKQEAIARVAAGEPTLTVLEAIRNAATLDYAVGPLTGSLDLTGLSAALRFMDANQGRAGTPTALVARGMTPIGQVPEPRQPPTITPAPTGSVSEIAKPTIAAAVLAAAAPNCDDDTLKAHEGVQAWTVAPGKILVALPCTAGAYNFGSALYLTDAKGGAPRPVNPQAPPDQTSSNIVVNMDFDPKTMELTSFDKGRGIGDCGLIAHWIWTGTAFALLEAWDLEACPGALSDDWPNIYKAELR